MILSKKRYPLTIGQQVVLLQQKYAINKAISNICIAVHFEKEIDHTLMMQALTNALYRNHSISIHIKKSGEDAYEQYFTNKTPEPIEVVDMRESTQEDLERYLKEQAAMEFPNDGFDVPLYRIKYILKPDGLSAIYFVVSHIAFDAYFMMFIAKDTFKIYECLSNNLPLPKPLPSPELYFEAEQGYLSSPDFLRDQEFWKEYYSTEPMYASLYGEDCPFRAQGTRYGQTSFGFEKIKSDAWQSRIPADLVRRAEDFAQKHRVSSQSLYIIAMRNILSKKNAFEEDITILTPFARRATRIEKLAGGSRVSAIPVRTNFSNELTFLEAAKEISKNVLMFYKYAELPFPFIAQSCFGRYNVPPGSGYMTLNFTYQPYSLEQPDELPFHLQYISNGQSAMPCYVTLMAVDRSGDLMGIYEYNKTFFPTTELIEELHAYIIKTLEYGLEHPESTLMEMMEKL